MYENDYSSTSSSPEPLNVPSRLTEITFSVRVFIYFEASPP